MLIISHRGVPGNGFENTLEAFDRAVQLGVDGIETDVRLTADGAAVLYHNRLAPDGREVAALGRAELSRLAGHPIPTLAEALAACEPPLWVVELKTPAVTDSALAALRTFQHARQLLVVSFWHTVIQRVARQLDVDCGLSMRHRPLELLVSGHSPLDSRLVRTIVWDYEFLDAEMIREAAEAGWRSFVFGPETLADHRHCRRLGVDGAITDHPHHLLDRQCASV